MHGSNELASFSPESQHELCIGVCALDKKARSKPMYDLLHRLSAFNEFDIIIFGDNVILEENVECWPSCDFLISFYSTGFPLHKAYKYVQEHKPFCVNDLLMQMILWDRRLVLMVLDALDVKTPSRLIANRDSGPELKNELKEVLSREFNIYCNDNCFPIESVCMRDYDTLQIGDKILRKPFVEKPVNGEDHNVYIYFSQNSGGGACKLFRKVADKSSVYDADLWHVRTEGSFIYEEYLEPDKYEDVKAYTIGPDYCYAETRKSPSLDGVVVRNANGKEVRYITELNEEEREIARTISMGFAQTVCGFDIVRKEGKSFVVDVNGWSFVKDNPEFYDLCAEELRKTFLKVSNRLTLSSTGFVPEKKSSGIWSLKKHISVIRHGDRTPKGKLKVSLEKEYHFAELFSVLLECTICKGEILVSDKESLRIVLQACESSLNVKREEMCHSSLDKCSNECSKLEVFRNILEQKFFDPDVKFQLRRIKKHPKILLLILKWGGEFTHSARHQSVELGVRLRNELKIMNRKITHNFQVFTSAERRVFATAEAFTKSFLNLAEVPDGSITISKELLDDTFDGKDQIDECKMLLKQYVAIENAENNSEDNLYLPLKCTPSNLLIHQNNSHVDFEQKSVLELFRKHSTRNYLSQPQIFIADFVSLINWHKVKFTERWPKMFKKFSQKKWCCSDSIDVFQERWNEIFASFPSVHKYNNSNAINMYDCLKFDAIHNKDILEDLFFDDENLKDPLYRLNHLYEMSRRLFCFLVPHEYGITREQKLSIGVNVSGALLQEIIQKLSLPFESDKPFCHFYFTKESHIYTMVNLILSSKLKCQYNEIELDYMTQIAFEIYERKNNGKKEHSFRIGVSPGSLSICGALKIQDMDSTHSIYPMPKIWITPYVPLHLAIHSLESLFV